MNIDLVYYFREVNHYYYLNGPEKVNGNIVNNSPAYQLSSASDVTLKINQMIASLAPDITNVVLVDSALYTGDIQINTYCGELKASSEFPDYTVILTSINTNLTNLNNYFYRLLCIFTGDAFSNASAQQYSFIKRLLDYVYRICCILCLDASNDSVAQQTSLIRSLDTKFKQSVTPNASITDVISALNSNIHNDLTNINTTTENKDTILLIDGQQEFKLRNKEEMDF